MLKEVAGRLQACLGESDALARLGGDEFAVLIDAADARGAENAALRVQAGMGRPFSFEDLDFTVTCSIGIALFPRDGHDADELLASAEQAMHWVKESGRSALRFHQPQREVDLLARMRLYHEMRQALKAHRFELRYQLQVSMGSGQVIGAEALIRWRDSLRGEIPPAEFIPVAEASGFILAIGDWVLQRAVEQAAAWWRAGRRIPIAVNVSALQFQQPRFVDFVDQTLREARLPDDGSDSAIVNAIVQMGNALNLNVTAEGVETEAQREFLRQAGCDEFQGCLYARALEAAAFEQLVWPSDN